MYKKILTGYVNQRKDGNGHYLQITNVSDSDVVIKAGEKIFLNRTPNETLAKYPKVPHYTKDVRIEEDDPAEVMQTIINTDDIPF